MLPRTYRLNLRLQRSLFTNCPRRQNSDFTVAISPATTPCFAILLTKKLLPLAVNRNHRKRQLHEIIHAHLETISPANYLIIPKQPSLKLSYVQLENSLLSLLH